MTDTTQTAAVAAPPVKLTAAERKQRDRLMKIITDGAQSFVKVGQALAEIHEHGLWVGEHDTFEAFCYAHWGFGKQQAKNHIRAAEIAIKVKPLVSLSNERQARALQSINATHGFQAVETVLGEIEASGRVPSEPVITETAKTLGFGPKQRKPRNSGPSTGDPKPADPRANFLGAVEYAFETCQQAGVMDEMTDAELEAVEASAALIQQRASGLLERRKVRAKAAQGMSAEPTARDGSASGAPSQPEMFASVA